MLEIKGKVLTTEWLLTTIQLTYYPKICNGESPSGHESLYPFSSRRNWTMSN